MDEKRFQCKRVENVDDSIARISFLNFDVKRDGNKRYIVIFVSFSFSLLYAEPSNKVYVQQNPGNSNSPANSNRVSIPLDFTQLFSHFYTVNSNSDNSKTPLTRTKFRFP